MEFVAKSFQKINVEALAEAEVFLEGHANGGNVNADAAALAETFVSASATAFAQVRAPTLTLT